MKKKQAYLLLAIGWFILSLVLFTLPGSAFPKEDWLDKIFFDKWVHTGLFAVLVILWCLSWYSFKTTATAGKLLRAFIIIGILFLGYGIAIEFIQKYWVVNRSFDVGDIIADGIGSAIGTILSARRHIKK